MSAKLVPSLITRYFDSNGDPLAGGKLYSYLAGTSTPAATYIDQAGITPNANPVVLDANGEAAVWLGSGSYKFILSDADDVVQWTKDDVSVDSQPDDISPPWVTHTVIDGQVAADLLEETVDFTKYSSGVWDVEILRGTTIFANGQVALQNLNGAARVKTGGFLAGESHGVTFSPTLTGSIAQLQAALSTGPGGGTIKLYKRLIPA